VILKINKTEYLGKGLMCLPQFGRDVPKVIFNKAVREKTTSAKSPTWQSAAILNSIPRR